MNDREIVSLFFARSEKAISELSAKYGKGFRLIARNIVQNEQTAEECENDAYLKTWNSVPPNDPSDRLFAYVARIVRNLSLDRVRSELAQKRNAVVISLTEELEACIPCPEPGNGEFAEKLNAFLAGQKKEKRQIFIRRYFYLDTIEAIGKRYGHSPSKVTSTLFRMRNELREYLKKT